VINNVIIIVIIAVIVFVDWRMLRNWKLKMRKLGKLINSNIGANCRIRL
jgi:hypothetical protein